MKNIISNSIKTIFETIGLSVAPQPKRTYALIPVKRDTRFKR